MTISFNAFPITGTVSRFIDLPDEAGFSISNANGQALLNVLGITKTCSSSPSPIQAMTALLTVIKRKQFGYRSPAIPATTNQKPGHALFIDCGRSEGYIERRLENFSDFIDASLKAGATHIGWG
ncbi:hypothetical protein [Beijerinckia mobilis]|uniref:hypothetical protein n=1 Tax=Beijerinckia mobilis TaxID=231434 RepID=UPI00054D9B19|nr:hypothetical protein [Beijerinckia mobilis]